MMHVNFDLPDEFAQRLQAKWHDILAHYARERLVMEGYRDDLLSTRAVQELLGLDDRGVTLILTIDSLPVFAQGNDFPRQRH